MADVTGSIGNEYVELNNAATEATLKQLVQAVQKQAGSGAAGAVGSTAGAAGVNTAAIEAAKAAAKAQKELGEKADNLKKTFSALAEGMMDLGGKLLQGTDKSSDLFSAFERLPGAAGLVASGFAKVARFQEENLVAYQKITDAGVNFGGSLTDMRTAAASTYMTLDQFAGLMKRNSETFAKLGGTAEQGARAFTGMSNSLMKSEAGDNLRALGYTSEQVNEGLAGYLANTGARTKQEMQNTAAITKGAGEYLTQLDGLATITGKSREEQEKALKQANANAAYEQFKMGMSEEQRAAYDKGMAEMSAKFGKAGEDLFKSQAMGLPPMTEAAQKLQALSPEVAKASQGMADVGKRGGSAAETFKLSAQATEGAANAAKRLSGVAGALSFSTDSTSQAMMGLTKESNRARAQGTETAAAGEKQQREIAEEQKKRQESEAKAAVENQKAMQELGQSILSILMPAIKLLTAVINPLAKFVSAVMTQFEKLNGIVQTIIVTGLALLAYQKLKSARQAAGQIPTGGSSGGSGGLGGSGIGKGLGGKLAGGLKGGVGGLVGGLALGAAADYAASNGMEKTGAGLDIASQAASFAGTGAMLGSIVPGLGTAVGGGLGAVAGGAYGLYQNWGKLFGESGQKKAADGLMVNTPTSILAGEAGPEIVAPTRHFENLQNELQTLNKQTAEMLRYLKETAESTRNSNDSIKNLGGDLFKF
jgi:hypothetical protein